MPDEPPAAFLSQLHNKLVKRQSSERCYQADLSKLAILSCYDELESRQEIIDVLSSNLQDSAKIPLSELKVSKRLGEGAFAVVDLCTHSTEDGTTEFAVKTMKTTRLLPPRYPGAEQQEVQVPETEIAKFQCEAALQRALRHPFVVGCYGFVKEPPEGGSRSKKLLLEYCPNGTLLDQLKKPRYSVSDALRWLHQIAQGMDYIHSLGVLHRDIKPENILLKGNDVRVADFSLFRMQDTSFGSFVKQSATDIDLDSPVNEKPVKDMTRMTGTPRYMAPECHESSNAPTYGNEVDVFSFAILAYELLARKRAYSEIEHLTIEQVAAAVQKSGLRPKLPKTWSTEITELLQRAWAPDPMQRPAFADLAAQIDRLICLGDDSPSGPAGLYGLKEYRPSSVHSAFGSLMGRRSSSSSVASSRRSSGAY